MSVIKLIFLATILMYNVTFTTIPTISIINPSTNDLISKITLSLPRSFQVYHGKTIISTELVPSHLFTDLFTVLAVMSGLSRNIQSMWEYINGTVTSGMFSDCHLMFEFASMMCRTMITTGSPLRLCDHTLTYDRVTVYYNHETEYRIIDENMDGKCLIVRGSEHIGEDKARECLARYLSARCLLTR